MAFDGTTTTLVNQNLAGGVLAILAGGFIAASTSLIAQ